MCHPKIYIMLEPVPHQRCFKVNIIGVHYIGIHMLFEKCVYNAKCNGISMKHGLPLSQILEVELFDVGGIDFMRILISSFSNKYILVVVDYVSRKVEVMTFPNNEGMSITKFLKRYIFTRFGHQGLL